MEEANEGEMLVLKRVLNSQKGVKDEQRENIFHSCYTIYRKVSSLIINVASCANVMSFSMIEN